VKLEPLTYQDIPRCVAIERQVFAGDSPWNSQAFQAELKAGYFYLVARTDEEAVAGYAGLAISGRENDRDAELHTIAVDPAYQGRGIGTALLKSVLAHADQLSAPIFLEVRTDNSTAFSLYERYGFSRIGLRKNYYRPSGADAFVMKREAVAIDIPGEEPSEPNGTEWTVQ
jgi:ribosomal-protein-alanine N-acetyltransferase